eukprot:9471495-Pyramimonas_sp.AAC.1
MHTPHQTQNTTDCVETSASKFLLIKIRLRFLRLIGPPGAPNAASSARRRPFDNANPGDPPPEDLNPRGWGEGGVVTPEMVDALQKELDQIMDTTPAAAPGATDA